MMKPKQEKTLLSSLPFKKGTAELRRGDLFAKKKPETKMEGDGNDFVQKIGEDRTENSSRNPSRSNTINDKLFQLRMKINQSRKSNRDETEEEFQKLNRKGKGKHAEKLEQKQKKASSQDEASLLNQTVESAEWEAEKKQKRAETAATYGLNAFTTEASYRAYEKRIEKLNHSDAHVSIKAKRNRIQEAQPTTTLVQQPLEYGRVGTEVSSQALELLSRDVVEREAKRRGFSKKRLGEDSGDVDFINEKNRRFNKKLRTAFDKYTVEIRQNLERGTAL